MAEPDTRCVERGHPYSQNLRGFSNVQDGNVPNIMLQMVLVFTISRAIHHTILRRLYQPLFISQLISGVIISKVQIGQYRMKSLFTLNHVIIRETLMMTGLGAFLFVVGVKINLSVLRNSGKKAAVIGVVGTILPMISVIFLGRMTNRWEPESIKDFRPSMKIGTTWCVTSYVNLSIFLNEYNLINSKLGRVALSSSLIAELILNVVSSINSSFDSRKTATSTLMASAPFLSMVAFVAFVVFVARPMAMRIVRKTPEGQQLSESHFTIILALALSCGLFSILIGHHIYMGMFVFGLVLPSGRPVGTTLVNRLELLVRELYVPLFMNTIGMTAEPFMKDDEKEALYISFLILLTILGKMIGVIGVALYYKFTFLDSLILSLMMCTKGIYEMEILSEWRFDMNFTFATYGVILIAIPVIAGVTSAPVKIMYNPSARHVAYKRRTIEHTKSGEELHILVCIHKQEEVPPIISLLNASYPTRESPLTVSTLHLMELVGSTASELVPYQQQRGPTSNPTETDHIVNAFRIFEHQSLGCVQLEPFMSVCPYASMHDDICALALDTKSSFLILPFHRRTTLDGTLEPMNQAFQAINVNVLDYAPCSIGILITHGSSYTSQMYQNVAVYFLGGSDDREALAIGIRMARNPNVILTVVRFLLPEDWRDKWEEKLDEAMLREFKFDAMGNKRVLYREEVVHNGEELVSIVTSMSKEFNLVMVGRRKELDMALSSSFSMWSEHPELGIVGDIFASADTGTNLCTLVVQQHVKVGEIKISELKF